MGKLHKLPELSRDRREVIDTPGIAFALDRKRANLVGMVVRRQQAGRTGRRSMELCLSHLAILRIDRDHDLTVGAKSRDAA